jgi:hypothetical protein
VNESKPVRFVKNATFIVVLVFLLVVAAALVLGGTAYYFWWAGPPRDPKCFALDDEDFGLGFHIGDPWDPDAFETTMKADGLDVIRSPHESRLEYNFHSASWYTTDYMFSVLLSSNDRTSDAVLGSIDLHPFYAGDSPDQATYRESKAFATRESLRNKAIKRFPNDDTAARQWYAGQYAEHVGKAVPQIRTAKGITLGSSEKEIRQAYGEPFDWVDIDDYCWLEYLGNQVHVTFFMDNRQVASINIHSGYRYRNAAFRSSAWRSFFMTEEEREARDEWLIGLGESDDGRELTTDGGEEATSEVESVRD